MLLSRAFTRNILYSYQNKSTFKKIRNISLTVEQLRIKRFRNMEKDIKTRENPIVTKLNTPEFKSLFTPELKTLIDLFTKYNYELRIAGGAVRDILMNIHPKDVDFATNATPVEMKEMFTKEEIRLINMKGEKHGTITPRINDKENFEITTLRIDVVTDGRHAEVQFTTDWQLDANRRDLTINSMFLGFDGSVYDYFYGYEDLKKRRVVFVGNADTRIKEDFLRILRYFRFYGRITENPNNHDEITIKAITENVSGLQIVSGERIWSEIKKTLEGNYAQDLIVKMLECGIGEYIGLPKTVDIKELDKVFQNSSLFKKPCYPITFITALLANTNEAIKLHERLKFSAFERDLALFITQNRSKLKDINEIIFFKKLAIQPYAKKEFIDEILKYLGKYDIYIEFINWKIPTLQINGNMLKEKGCPPGKIMGTIMSELKLIWANDNFQISIDDLLNIHLPKILENCDLKKHNNKKIKIAK